MPFLATYVKVFSKGNVWFLSNYTVEKIEIKILDAKKRCSSREL
jgi:hypothetical protein